MSSSRPTTARDLSKQQLKELREAFRLFDKGQPINDALPPYRLIKGMVCTAKFTQPPFLWPEFGHTPHL